MFRWDEETQRMAEEHEFTPMPTGERPLTEIFAELLHDFAESVMNDTGKFLFWLALVSGTLTVVSQLWMYWERTH